RVKELLFNKSYLLTNLIVMSNDKQHKAVRTVGCGLVLEPVRELLDHRVGEHFAGDALDLGLGGRLVHAAIQGELKELALANRAHALVAHLAERAMDGFALRIEDGGLEHDSNVSLHGYRYFKSGLPEMPKLREQSAETSAYNARHC